MTPDEREYVTIRVLKTQLDALREHVVPLDGAPELSDDELYSMAAIAILVYLPGMELSFSRGDQKSENA